MLLATVFVCSASLTAAQVQLATLREIKLPVPMFRGIWWSGPGQSRWYFSIKLAQDHALVAFEPNKNGKWPLVRVRNWWTNKPTSEVLNIPGWSSADAKNLERLNTGLQITPDGHYAVTFADAVWKGSPSETSLDKSTPKGIVSHKPDTIITLIDLEKWQIVGSVHSASLQADEVEDRRILSNSWLALTWIDSESSRKTATLDHRYGLVSLPNLRPGPACTKEGASGTTEEVRNNAEALSTRNDAACAKVLKASGIDSMRALASRVSSRSGPPTMTFDASLLGNSLFESSSSVWYGVDSVHSELSIFDADGRTLQSKVIPHLLCASQPVQGPSWGCSCSIEGVSEVKHVLLAYCLTTHDNFFGSQSWLKQWLSVFSSEDLSEIGFVGLSNQKETRSTIAAVDGRAYVLAVELGETLRVYAIPDRP